jgi:hypothetical protein
MTSIRIAFATVLAAGALFAGGATHAQHSAPANAGHSTVLAVSLRPMSPIWCCD